MERAIALEERSAGVRSKGVWIARRTLFIAPWIACIFAAAWNGPGARPRIARRQGMTPGGRQPET